MWPPWTVGGRDKLKLKKATEKKFTNSEVHLYNNKINTILKQ